MRNFLPGERPFETVPKVDERYDHIWVGIVRRYDQDHETCDVEWITYPGGRPAVRLGYALAGRRAFMGGPPEEGSIVYCAWIPHTAMGQRVPVIVAYGPSGHALAKFFHITKELRDPDEFKGRRIKTPKLYPGDMAMVSSAGSHVLADENLHLTSASLADMLLRSSDMALISNFLQYYQEAAGSRIRMGMVERSNEIVEADYLHEDGRRPHYVTKNQDGTRLEDGGLPWAEHRIELRETATGGLSVPESLFDSKTVDRHWLIQHVLGVLVGDNPQALYKKPLVRRVLSGSSIDRAYLAATSNEHEEKAVSVWHIALRNGDDSAADPKASIDLDRSGRLAVSLGKTDGSHPVGEGKSLQLALDGSFNASIGSEASGLSYNVKVSGDVLTEIGGDSEVAVAGDSTHEVAGNYDLNVSGISNIGGSTIFLGNGGATVNRRPF